MEFYELMQAYRHAPLAPQEGVIKAYNDVINWILAELMDMPNQGADDIAEWMERRIEGDG